MNASRQIGAWLFVALAAGVLAAPTPAMADSDIGNIGDLGQAVASLLIFLVLMLILGKYAWKPVVEALRRREQDMETRAEAAKDRETKAELLLQEYQQRIARAETEADDILVQARRDAEAERDEILRAARDEARDTIDAAQRDIDAAESQALEELKGITAKMAADIAGRVIQDELGEDGHRRLIDHAARQIADSAGSKK